MNKLINRLIFEVNHWIVRVHRSRCRLVRGKSLSEQQKKKEHEWHQPIKENGVERAMETESQKETDAGESSPRNGIT